MTNEICSQLFENLYDNKIIILPGLGPFCFCEFLKYDFNDNKLTIHLKVLNPVVKLKQRYKIWFEKAINKDFIEIQYNFIHQENIILKIEDQHIVSIYGSSIWANHDLVKKVYELKALNLIEEIYQILE